MFIWTCVSYTCVIHRLWESISVGLMSSYPLVSRFLIICRKQTVEEHMRNQCPPARVCPDSWITACAVFDRRQCWIRLCVYCKELSELILPDKHTTMWILQTKVIAWGISLSIYLFGFSDLGSKSLVHPPLLKVIIIIFFMLHIGSSKTLLVKRPL